MPGHHNLNEESRENPYIQSEKFESRNHGKLKGKKPMRDHESICEEIYGYFERHNGHIRTIRHRPICNLL